MCKFHRSVARDVATVSGTFVPSYFIITLLALSKHGLETYMPDHLYIGGSVPSEMTEPSAWAAYERSGLKRPLAEVTRDHESGVAFVRERLRNLENRMDISPAALGFPPLPPAFMSFLDYGLDHLYEGNPKTGLVAKADKLEFQPWLEATREFASDPQTAQTIQLLLEGSICRHFEEAKIKMEAGSRHWYESAFVEKVKGTVGLTGGGLLSAGTSHAGCVIGGLLPAAATGAGGMAAMGAGLGISALFNIAGLYAWHEHLGGKYKTPLFKGVMAAGVGGMMVAVNLFSHGAHHHGGQGHVMPDISDAQVQEYIGDMKVRDLQNLQFMADNTGQSLEEYIRALCITDTSPPTKTGLNDLALSP